jgi:hypothetical protein
MSNANESRVGGTAAAGRVAPPTPDPSPPLASLAGGGETNVGHLNGFTQPISPR